MVNASTVLGISCTVACMAEYCVIRIRVSYNNIDSTLAGET